MTRTQMDLLILLAEIVSKGEKLDFEKKQKLDGIIKAAKNENQYKYNQILK